MSSSSDLLLKEGWREWISNGLTFKKNERVPEYLYIAIVVLNEIRTYLLSSSTLFHLISWSDELELFKRLHAAFTLIERMTNYPIFKADWYAKYLPIFAGSAIPLFLNSFIPFWPAYGISKPE